MRLLSNYGWFPGRSRKDVERGYISALGPHRVPVASQFVRSFGNLTVPGRLWIGADKAIHHLPKADRVASFCGCRCSPLATSGYMGDGGCGLWMDEKNRFYAVDDEGMVFLAEGSRDVMEVLLNGSRAKEPPEEIRDAMKRACNWDEN